MEENIDELVTVYADCDKDFVNEVDKALLEVRLLLKSKNTKYGNSALNPLRIFSKASVEEQLLVRIDDKLSRLKTQHFSEDEDVLDDLIGYLVLLKMYGNKNLD